MTIPFYKYQGAGNDFILIDNRKNIFEIGNLKLVTELCDRKFGIGSDGLMLLQNKAGYDFEMIFYNPDGSQSLCGNGSRCIVEFARHLNIIKDKASFVTFDGAHTASVLNNGIISLKMNDVLTVEQNRDSLFLNTGSPHVVKKVSALDSYNVYEEGKKMRYDKKYLPGGTNVNFIEEAGDYVRIRTYERGVENETLACGTGVTAAAIVASLLSIATSENYCKIKAKGGELNVRFKKTGAHTFTDIYLEGPAEFVYKGEVTI
jgi:diaminopimelate epimerase